MKELSNRPQDLLDMAALKHALNDQSDPSLQNTKTAD